MNVIIYTVINHHLIRFFAFLWVSILYQDYECWWDLTTKEGTSGVTMRVSAMVSADLQVFPALSAAGEKTTPSTPA